MINRYVVEHLLIDDLELRKKKIAIADHGCTLMVSVSGYCKGKLMFYFHEQNKQILFVFLKLMCTYNYTNMKYRKFLLVTSFIPFVGS